MDTLVLVMTIVLIVISVALVAIILFQSGRNANVSEAIGGGLGSSAARNKSAAKDLFLKRATIIFSILFVLIILVVNIIEVV